MLCAGWRKDRRDNALSSEPAVFHRYNGLIAHMTGVATVPDRPLPWRITPLHSPAPLHTCHFPLPRDPPYNTTPCLQLRSPSAHCISQAWRGRLLIGARIQSCCSEGLLFFFSFWLSAWLQVKTSATSGAALKRMPELTSCAPCGSMASSTGSCPALARPSRGRPPCELPVSGSYRAIYHMSQMGSALLAPRLCCQACLRSCTLQVRLRATCEWLLQSPAVHSRQTPCVVTCLRCSYARPVYLPCACMSCSPGLSHLFLRRHLCLCVCAAGGTPPAHSREVQVWAPAHPPACSSTSRSSSSSSPSATGPCSSSASSRPCPARLGGLPHPLLLHGFANRPLLRLGHGLHCGAPSFGCYSRVFHGLHVGKSCFFAGTDCFASLPGELT